MTGTASTSRILHDAAAIIHTRGWIQEAYVTPDGFCAAGAIRAVTENYDEIEAAQAVLAKLLRDNGFEDAVDYETQFVKDFELITTWNDAYERTKDEVVRLMRDASIG